MVNFRSAAKHLCIKHNVTAYSKALPVDPEKEAIIRMLFKAITPIIQASNQLQAGTNTIQVAVVHEGKVTALTAPLHTLMTANEGQNKVSVSVGDTMGQPHPGIVHEDTLRASFTSIVKLSEATALSLPTADDDPAQTEGPPANADDEAVNEEINAPNTGYQRLHWIVSEEGDAPVVVSLPIAFAIPQGTKAPFGQDISDTFTEEDVPFEPLRVWLAAMAYIVRYNNGQSITAAGPLFPANAFAMEPFNGLTIAENVQDYHELTMLNPNSKEFEAVVKRMGEVDLNLYTKAAEHLHDDEPENQGQGVNSGLTAPQITALVTSMAVNKPSNIVTYQEKQALQTGADVCIRYSILGAKITSDPDGTKTIVPGKLTDAFKKVIDTASPQVSMGSLQDILSQEASAAKTKNNALAMSVSISSSIVDAMFTKSLQTFNWLAVAPTQQPEKIKTSLSIWAFLTPETGSVDYMEKVDQSTRLSNQLMVEEDKSKLTRRSTELYIRGSQTEFQHVISALANFLCFMSTAVEDFEDSILWSILSQFIDHLRSDHGRTWCNIFRDIPECFMNIMLDIHNVIFPFIALATRQSLRTVVAAGETIPVPPFAAIEAQSLHILNNFSSLLGRCDADRYANRLSFMLVFDNPTKKRHHDQLSPTNSSRGNGRGNDNDNGNGNGNGSRPSSDNAIADNRNRQQGGNRTRNHGNANENGNRGTQGTQDTGGALQYDRAAAGGRPMPFSRITVRKSPNDPNDTTRTAICFAHALIGRSCRNGTSCHFHHIDRANDLPHDIRAGFNRYVENTPNLKWVSGKGPNTDTVGAYIPIHSSLTAAVSPLVALLNSTAHASSYNPIPSEIETEAAPLDVLEFPHPPTGTTDSPPLSTDATPTGPTSFPVKKTKSANTTHQAREEFVRTKLPKNHQLILAQDFGKPNLDRCFKLEASFPLVLLPLYNSGFLAPEDQQQLHNASSQARILIALFDEHNVIDFRPLRDYPVDWQDENEINYDRMRMTTAAVLHYQGDLASVVRFIGGIHVGAHRDHKATLRLLEGVVDESILRDLRRIWISGIPNKCNAESTQKNFQAYLDYGNHKSVTVHPDKTRAAFVKDNKRSFNLIMDLRLVHFILNCQLTPQGMVNLSKPTKKDRPVFDSGFRPHPWSMAINDWTNKCNEPPLVFPKAFEWHLIHIYNLRISHPKEKIDQGDDDICGAFRHGKYHPDLVAMHCATVDDILTAATGTTFGDTTSPPNFEPVAQARRQLAQHYWNDPKTITAVAHLLPPITYDDEATPDDTTTYQPANADSKNTGVINPDGSRRPPPFSTHVDDCFYAETRPHMKQTVCASIRSLYDILGHPNARSIDVLSHDKLHAQYGHLRRLIGQIVDTQKLLVILPDDKRQEVVVVLLSWLNRETFTLRECAELHGFLESISRYNRWGRAQFCTLQSAMRRILQQRYQILKRQETKAQEQKRARFIRKQLPSALEHRLLQILRREEAQLLWNTNAKHTISKPMRIELKFLHDYLADISLPWNKSIGHIIPRDTHLHSWGDACLEGGGAHCPSLEFWFDNVWSEEVRRRTKLPASHKHYIQINALEFCLVVLQYAAINVAFATFQPSQLRKIFPSGVPAEPIADILCDNTSGQSWANKASSKSLSAQNLIKIYAELLLISRVGLSSSRVSTEDNDIADFLSRPTIVSVSRPPPTGNISEIQLHEILVLFPAESRDATTPYIRAMRRTMAGPSQTSKQRGTLRSRVIHYLMFAYHLKWTDDVFMVDLPILRCNYQLAIYAAQLAAGESLTHRQIKCDTIKGYVRAIAFVFANQSTSGRDIRKRNPTDTKFCPQLEAVYTEVSRYEKMPNRREPFTLEMLHHQQEASGKLGTPGNLSRTAAFADWSEVGLFNGQRLTEWAQPPGNHSTPSNAHIQEGYTEPRAFRLCDIILKDRQDRRLEHSKALADPTQVWTIDLTWRTQKNFNNGEHKIYCRNPKSDGHCFVRPMMRILARFVTLRGYDNLTPLSVYRANDTAPVSLITDRDIEQSMRSTASAVYGLDPIKHKKELQRWSSHSYRVGAAVILHGNGYNGPQIKFLLRWKSDTFMMYLRNLKILAIEHYMSLDKADAMPHFV